MYKLKIKSGNCSIITTRYFDSIEEVTQNIMITCNADTIEDCLKYQKEYNIRFYVKEIKNK